MSKMKHCTLCAKELRLRRRRMNPDCMTMRCADCNEPDRDFSFKPSSQVVDTQSYMSKPTNVMETALETPLIHEDVKQTVNGEQASPLLYVKETKTEPFAPVIKEQNKKKKKEKKSS